MKFHRNRSPDFRAIVIERGSIVLYLRAEFSTKEITQAFSFSFMKQFRDTYILIGNGSVELFERPSLILLASSNACWLLWNFWCIARIACGHSPVVKERNNRRRGGIKGKYGSAQYCRTFCPMYISRWVSFYAKHDPIERIYLLYESNVPWSGYT